MLQAPLLEEYAKSDNRTHILALGPLYLHAFLREKNIPVFYSDPEVEGIDDAELIAFIREKDPLFVGISSLSSNYREAMRMARTIKQHLKHIPIVLGGPQASAIPEVILKIDAEQFDFLCIGEGEDTIYELYQALLAKDDTREIDGLALPHDGEARINKPRGFIADLDSLPFPSRDQVDLRRYNGKGHLYRPERAVPLITSRGCPFKCDYCQSKHILGSKIRFHSADYVLAEIEELYYRYGARYIWFVDDVFTANRKRLTAICEGIANRGLDIKFWCMARAEMIDEASLQLLKKAGMHSMSIGVESGDEEILKGVGKGSRLDDAVKAFDLLRKHKVESHAFFMIGFYHDTHETVMKTINFAKELDPDFASFTVMAPFPGTEVFEKHYKHMVDFSDPDVWRHFHILGGGQTGFGGKYLSREENSKYRDMAFRQFFLRPRKIAKLATKIHSVSQLFELSKSALYVFQGHRN